MSAGDLEQLLAAKEVVVVCGPGGVGKTTMAAAAGVLAAQRLGGRVLVLTVDPARRLATALGLASLGNEPTRIDPAALRVDDSDARGELWVAQLDTKESWDQLVGRHAPDAKTRDAILRNTLYENVTRTFVQSHDYIAMERLHELHGSGEYDLIIVDTPPTRNAVDFLDAPERMADFFSSRLLRWLTVPYRSRLFTAASRPFYSVADRVLGQEFLRDIADFFLLFQTMYKGFVERAEEVQRTLHDRRTTFLVVSTLDSSSVTECSFFIDALRQRQLHLGAVILNRVLPRYFGSKSAATAARKLDRRAPELVEALALDAPDDLAVGVLREVAGSFLDYAVVAAREQELQAERADDVGTVLTVPYVTTEIVDVRGLGILSELLRT